MLQLGIMIIIGALIGWITNKVAIKMLFRPVNPVKILFFKIQGVFPKRKDQMAISLADTIESELLSKEVIMDKILNTDNLEEKLIAKLYLLQISIETKAEISNVEMQFQQLFKDYGKNKNTLGIQLLYAEFLAFNKIITFL